MDESLNDSIEKLISEIKESVKKINGFQQQRIVVINDKIDNIIKNNIMDNNEIEKTLDCLLDLAYWDYEKVLDSFEKIINYYEKINLYSAKEYKKYFKRVKEEEY